LFTLLLQAFPAFVNDLPHLLAKFDVTPVLEAIPLQNFSYTALFTLVRS
jgi:hypothetical protein